MRLAGWIFLMTFVLSSCNDTSPDVIKEVPTKAEKKKEASPKDKKLWLTDENAESILLPYFKENTERKFIIQTKLGDIEIELSNKTPIHTGNFVFLVKEKNYFDSTLFYRVAPKFIVQGGDADTDNIQTRRFSIGQYHLPAEMNKEGLYHRRGAIAMTRNYGDNPNKISTPYDFYIVLGKRHNEMQLQAIERDQKISFTDEQREVYKTIGGAPHLDGQHTVFGYVTKGIEVAEKISLIEADTREWPYENISMSIKPIK